MNIFIANKDCHHIDVSSLIINLANYISWEGIAHDPQTSGLNIGTGEGKHGRSALCRIVKLSRNRYTWYSLGKEPHTSYPVSPVISVGPITIRVIYGAPSYGTALSPTVRTDRFEEESPCYPGEDCCAIAASPGSATLR